MAAPETPASGLVGPPPMARERFRPRGRVAQAISGLGCFRHDLGVGGDAFLLEKLLLHKASSKISDRSRAPGSINVAVTGVVAIVIVIAMAFVATERFEIDLVQNDSYEIIVDAASSIESVLRVVDLSFSPFYNEHIRINEMSGRANVHQGSDRGEINDHVIVAFA
jgi:hypothetical protein